MSLLEKDIEERVVRWAKERGFLTPKVRFIEIGYPDRLFISPYGHTIFIEFKRPGEKPDPIQNLRIKQLTNRSIPAYWVDSYEQAIFILKAAVDSKGLPDPSDQTPVVSSIRRAISRSRAGQDVDGPRYDKDTEEQRVDQSRVNRSPPETDDGDLA